MATVISGQGIMDVSVEHTGSLEHIFKIALANNQGITDNLVGGQQLEFEAATYNKKVVDTYKRKEIHPGNAEILEDEEAGGIGFMKIGDDFIIS